MHQVLSIIMFCVALHGLCLAQETEGPAEAMSQASSSLEHAVSNKAAPSDYLISLVKTLHAGDKKNYSKYLLTPSEVTNNISEEDFRAGLEMWTTQFDLVHDAIRAKQKIEIIKIALTPPGTPEEEAAMRARLRGAVKEVHALFSSAELLLEIDEHLMVIDIGGLVKTNLGWRVAGAVIAGTPES